MSRERRDNEAQPVPSLDQVREQIAQLSVIAAKGGRAGSAAEAELLELEAQVRKIESEARLAAVAQREKEVQEQAEAARIAAEQAEQERNARDEQEAAKRKLDEAQQPIKNEQAALDAYAQAKQALRDTRAQLKAAEKAEDAAEVDRLAAVLSEHLADVEIAKPWAEAAETARAERLQKEKEQQEQAAVEQQRIHAQTEADAERMEEVRVDIIRAEIRAQEKKVQDGDPTQPATSQKKIKRAAEKEIAALEDELVALEKKIAKRAQTRQTEQQPQSDVRQDEPSTEVVSSPKKEELARTAAEQKVQDLKHEIKRQEALAKKGGDNEVAAIEAIKSLDTELSGAKETLRQAQAAEAQAIQAVQAQEDAKRAEQEAQEQARQLELDRVLAEQHAKQERIKALPAQIKQLEEQAKNVTDVDVRKRVEKQAALEAEIEARVAELRQLQTEEALAAEQVAIAERRAAEAARQKRDERISTIRTEIQTIESTVDKEKNKTKREGMTDRHAQLEAELRQLEIEATVQRDVNQPVQAEPAQLVADEDGVDLPIVIDEEDWADIKKSQTTSADTADTVQGVALELTDIAAMTDQGEVEARLRKVKEELGELRKKYFELVESRRRTPNANEKIDKVMEKYKKKKIEMEDLESHLSGLRGRAHTTEAELPLTGTGITEDGLPEIKIVDPADIVNQHPLPPPAPQVPPRSYGADAAAAIPPDEPAIGVGQREMVQLPNHSGFDHGPLSDSDTTQAVDTAGDEYDLADFSDFFVRDSKVDADDGADDDDLGGFDDAMIAPPSQREATPDPITSQVLQRVEKPTTAWQTIVGGIGNLISTTRTWFGKKKDPTEVLDRTRIPLKERFEKLDPYAVEAVAELVKNTHIRTIKPDEVSQIRKAIRRGPYALDTEQAFNAWLRGEWGR